MTLLQFGIGIVNDVVDAPRDAGRKPGKPIPAGLMTVAAARTAAVASFTAGTLVGFTVSPTVGVLALVVIAIGLVYDLLLKGTAWSWLPFAVGIPILPVFGWLGATGTLHPLFAVLLPVAVLAGAALAIGNALVDVERDRGAGISSIAVALGADRAAATGVALVAAVWVLAASSAVVAGAAWPAIVAVAGVGVVPLIATFSAVRASTSARRERLWQVEAVGLAGLAAAWLTAVLGRL
jgi:4-hydroxybenzoate polyprenyltransferase